LISRRVHGPLELPGMQHNNVHRWVPRSCFGSFSSLIVWLGSVL
jgi:hypothetical protein